MKNIQTHTKRFFFALVFCSVTVVGTAQQKAQTYQWQALFNGKDLSGWDIKIAGVPINNNFKNTFRVEDSMLRVSYNEYDSFKEAYGHLYYHKPFSNYILRVQYRFTGEQTKGGASWNVRNSGVMIHSQSAASMGINQSFPVSLEVQFLGGLGKGPRETANLCTPGTTVETAGKTFFDHILQSSSKTYDGDQWVTVDAIVLNDSLIQHYVNGEKVLSYTKPKVGGGFVSADFDWERAHVPNAAAWIKRDNTPLKEGYIALQAESHPIDFKKVELLNLDDIPNWKSLHLEKLLQQ